MFVESPRIHPCSSSIKDSVGSRLETEEHRVRFRSKAIVVYLSRKLVLIDVVETAVFWLLVLDLALMLMALMQISPQFEADGINPGVELQGL